MSKEYQILSKKASMELANLLSSNCRIILPMVELIEESRMAVAELIETLGRSTIRAVSIRAGAAKQVS